jgi:hypothetical protein
MIPATKLDFDARDNTPDIEQYVYAHALPKNENNGANEPLPQSISRAPIFIGINCACEAEGSSGVAMTADRHAT